MIGDEATSSVSYDAAPLGTAAELSLRPPPSRTGRDGRPILTLKAGGRSNSKSYDRCGPPGPRKMTNRNIHARTRATPGSER
jgi:hypothetical protein